MDHELIHRAERAALGAMISSPSTAARLAHLRTGDFGNEQHRVVHRAIVAAQPGQPADGHAWREAILQQGAPQVTCELLAMLEDACPYPNHGATYGWLVIQGASRRSLETIARQTAARAAQASGEAYRLRQSHAPEAAAARDAARHGTQVAQALRRQAAGISVPQVHPVAIRHSGLSASQQRLEEAALASVAGPQRGRARQIARMLPPEAFGDYYRRAVYATACQMHEDGRHVDELTLDWEVARLGLPLRYEPGGQTIGERLARIRSGGERPIEAARQLQERYERAHGPRAPAPARDREPPGPGARERAQVPGGPPPLRLVQPPPGHEHGKPGHGPRPTT